MKHIVVITAQDRPDTLNEVIEAVKNQGPLNIVVAYRNIPEPSMGIIPVPCNDLPPTWQIGRMHNRGALEAIKCGATHLIFLDGDCVPQPGWFDTYQRWNDVDLLIGRIDREAQDGSIEHDYRLKLSSGDDRIHQGGGGNFCISVPAFKDVPGFDAEFDGGWGFEETDLFQRVIDRGWYFRFHDAAIVVHRFHEREPDHFEGLERNRKLYNSRYV